MSEAGKPQEKVSAAFRLYRFITYRITFSSQDKTQQISPRQYTLKACTQRKILTAKQVNLFEQCCGVEIFRLYILEILYGTDF